MTAFLDSIGYNGWILPVLLGLPIVGALVLFARALSGSGDAQARMAADRQFALIVFLV